eukprot:m51a1_g4310 hypothetical protein (230) ;mRNA; f:39637-40743
MSEAPKIATPQPPAQGPRITVGRDDSPQSTHELGHISAVIEGNALKAWDKDGVFAGQPDPEHTGQHDFDYNSWRVVAKSGTVRVSVSHEALPPLSPDLDPGAIGTLVLGTHGRAGADSPVQYMTTELLETVAWLALGVPRGLCVKMTYAGWDSETPVSVRFNGTELAKANHVGGSAWVNPFVDKFLVPLEALRVGPPGSPHHDKHVIELELEKEAQMVLFLRSIGLVSR